MKNRPEFKWYVVNLNTISIDSGHRDIAGASERAAQMGGGAKCMTKPRVGAVTLDPNDDASWMPKRNNPSHGRTNPRRHPGQAPYFGGAARHVSDDEVEAAILPQRHPVLGHIMTPRGDQRAPRVHRSGSEVGSYVKRVGSNRVYQVDAVDGTSATICDTTTGECFRVPLDEFVDFVHTNPARRRSRARTEGDLERMEFLEDLAWESSPEAREKERREKEAPWVLSSAIPRGQGWDEDAWGVGWHAREYFYEKKDAETQAKKYAALAGRGGRPADLKWKVWHRSAFEIGSHGGLHWPRPRQNPGELLILNPDEGPDSARAEKVYEMWHQKEPHNIQIRRPGVDLHDTMVCIGHAHNIVYRSGKWEQGRKTNDYVHHFDSKPKVWMLERVLSDEDYQASTGDKSVADLVRSSLNADGQCAVADLATPISFGLDDGTSEGEDITIHSGARVYGAVDKKTVIIFDPTWKIIVIRGGKMTFDERGIVK